MAARRKVALSIVAASVVVLLASLVAAPLADGFSLTLTSAAPEIFNPAIGGEPGKPAFNGPGVVVAGTCTATAS